MFLFILKYIFFFNSLFKRGLDWILMGILSMPSYDRPGERLTISKEFFTEFYMF